MNKRFFAFLLSFLLLFPLLPASAQDLCEHILSGQVADDEWEMINVVPAQEGVDGYADLCCPICYQIVDSIILPALPVEAEHPAASDDEFQYDPEPEPEPEEVWEPEPEVWEPEPEPEPEVWEPEPEVWEPEPEEWEPEPEPEEEDWEPEPQIVESEEPAQQQEEPRQTVQQEAPAAQEESVRQEEPAAQSKSAAQEEPAAQSKSAAQEEEPATKELSEEPAKAAQPEAPAAQEKKDAGAVTPPESKGTEQTGETKADPPKAADVIANVLPETNGRTETETTVNKTAADKTIAEETVADKTAEKAKTTRTTVYTAGYHNARQPETTKQKRTYPFRRVKMKPRKGIRAEIPGILIWPANGTPFQVIFND